jgi:hypothetical protein
LNAFAKLAAGQLDSTGSEEILQEGRVETTCSDVCSRAVDRERALKHVDRPSEVGLRGNNDQ